MTSLPTIAEVVEDRMIQNDTVLYLDLVNCMKSSRKFYGLIPGFIPYVSLFMIESYAYLAKVRPDYAQSIKFQYEADIHNARHKVKLFEVDDLIAMLEWAVKHQKAHFNEGHKGILAPLKRLWQADMGLYFYEEHLISTTTNVFITTTPKRNTNGTFDTTIMQSSPEELSSFGESIGRYVSHLYADLTHDANGISISTCRNNLSDDLIRHKDVKSDRYLVSIFNGSSSVQVNLGLLTILIFLNYFRYVIQHLVVDTPEALFKLKYIVLYQVGLSLNKLRAYYYRGGVFTDRSRDFFKALVDDREIKRLLSQPRFRNILIHYNLEAFPTNNIILDAKFFGLVEYFFNGQSMDELNSILDRQIDRVSKTMESWLLIPQT
jgi:hypothetical protein